MNSESPTAYVHKRTSMQKEEEVNMISIAKWILNYCSFYYKLDDFKLKIMFRIHHIFPSEPTPKIKVMSFVQKSLVKQNYFLFKWVDILLFKIIRWL